VPNDDGGRELTGRVESFNGRFRDEYLNEKVFAGLAETRAVIKCGRLDYD
jgi:Integrase core domain